MRFLAPTAASNPPPIGPRNAVIPHCLQVFIPHDIISFRMNAYALPKAPLKTSHFNPLWNEHLRKIGPHLLQNEHLQKNRGGGGYGRASLFAFRLLPTAYSTYNAFMPGVTSALQIRPATEADTQLVFGFIRKLAEYGDLSDEVSATAKHPRAALFGKKPVAEAILAYWGSEPAGFALYFLHVLDVCASPVLPTNPTTSPAFTSLPSRASGENAERWA